MQLRDCAEESTNSLPAEKRLIHVARTMTGSEYQDGEAVYGVPRRRHGVPHLNEDMPLVAKNMAESEKMPVPTASQQVILSRHGTC